MKKKGLFSDNDRAPAKLNITSLMDALTIILIFLLVNYSEQPEERDLPKFLSLPKVSGKIDTQKEVPLLVNIGTKKITVGKTFNYEFNSIEKDIESIKEKVGAFLQEQEKKTSSQSTETKDSDKNKKPSVKKVTVNADKSIRYELLSEIISILADNGYSSIDFMNLTKKD